MPAPELCDPRVEVEDPYSKYIHLSGYKEGFWVNNSNTLMLTITLEGEKEENNYKNYYYLNLYTGLQSGPVKCMSSIKL
jgi:hypothetical protein